MRKTLFLSIFLTSSVFTQADDVTVLSPDSNLQVTISTNDGDVTYAATLGGLQVLEKSSLGLKTSVGDFTHGLTMKNCHKKEVFDCYTMRSTKAASSEYHANQLTLDFENQEGRTFMLSAMALIRCRQENLFS